MSAAALATVKPEVAWDPAAAVRRWRGWALLAALIAALVVLLGVLGSTPTTQELDPTGTSPSGAAALVALLRDRGVRVDVVRDPARLVSAAQGTGTTVVVPAPGSATIDQLAAIANTRATVLAVTDEPSEVAALDGHGRAVGDGIDPVLTQPACSLPALARAGAAKVGGTPLQPDSAAVGCFPVGGGFAVLTAARPSGGVTLLLGSPATLTNDDLATAGDAALGIDLLATTPSVTWLVPQPPTAVTGDGQSRRSLSSLLPSRVRWALLQGGVALLVVALWRARRLGAPVPEPLPVVVRAAETVEGRGRLLRVARARGTAAAALRAAAVRRISAVSGRPPSEVGAQLAASAPATDTDLVRLADDVDRIVADATDPARPGGQP